MRSILIASSMLLASLAQAHETTGPNGGRLVDAGDLHVELVSKGREIDVFVTDANDKPLPVEGYKGTAVLVINGKPQRIPLAPADANRLTGAAAIDIPKTARGAVQLQLPAGGSVQGRFQ
ncbi:MAG: hypothetical protein Q8M31_03105 [Beijerinckiaceae bacterium]|nr:hypothetical protein [Beijerinckiaceae bacterium]